MLITIGYVQSKCKAWLGIERISVKGKHYVCFDAILTLHNAYPLVRRCVSKTASC